MEITSSEAIVLLEHGDVTPELSRAIGRMVAKNLRPGDLDELLDMLHRLRYTDEEINADFGTLLQICLGLQEERARYYSLNYVPLEKSEPLFVATLTTNGEGVALMRGFGVEKGYSLISKREIYHSINYLFESVLNDMVDVFGVDFAICHVKATNTPTLRMWHFLQRVEFRTGDGRYAVIRIADDPFLSGYKLVTIELTDGGAI